MTMAAPQIDESIKEARDLAWNHFNLHAGHRMEMFRSYVTYIAVVYAGYGWSLQAKAYWIGALLGLFAIIISISFFLFRPTNHAKRNKRI
jgi:lipoprotein signal peptidase